MSLVFVPVLPGLFWALGPALDATVWVGLWQDNQLPSALRATLVSSFLGTALACAVAGLIATFHYPSQQWEWLQRRLPLLLSVPHAAFAIGFFFLIAPSGWLARAIAIFAKWLTPPDLVTAHDDLGISLAIALAIKESWFLLWALAAILNEQHVSRHMVMGRSLGYSRTQTWIYILWPQLLPRLIWPVVAVLAYGLSVVDMGLILGPSTPPTLAVLTWRWLTDPDINSQARGSAASLVLLLLLLGTVLTTLWLGIILRRNWPYPRGKRVQDLGPNWAKFHVPILTVGYAIITLLVIWSVAGEWFFPRLFPSSLSMEGWRQVDWNPVLITLRLGLIVSLICLPLVLLWLEWGPRNMNALIYIPLILPSLPLVAGQYAVLLRLNLDGTEVALIWTHLLWVLPYMLLTLVGPYRAFDQRLVTSARALGKTRWKACWSIKWPVLFRPILLSVAVGFSVSVAQYLPTLFAGAGRFATITTEAVALSSGGNRRTIAVQAILQIGLPMVMFSFVVIFAKWFIGNRRGLR